ncbi:MAG: hypothetical protein IPO60_03410 [Flavobacteriales bacterium]|nr:hypothetical protein [Flavobacteriales bacterium]
MRTRKLVLFSSVILVAGSLHAQLPRIILQSGGIPQVFTTVNEALTAAQPNDKLYFSGGTFLEAAGITIDKPLHFIGAGISPDTANVTGVTTLSTGGSTRITILTEAGGSTFTGINFNPGGNIQYGTDPNDDDPKDLIFQRCAFAKAIGMAIEEGASASSSFDECIFRGTITGGASNAVITNSILDGATLSLFRPSGLIIRNSVVLDARLQNSGNAIVQNCVFTYNGAPLWQVGGVQISNCLVTGNGMFSNSSGNQESNNIYGQAAGSIFVNEANGVYSFDDDLHMDPTSPGVGAGNDGRDIGIYGGGSPYKEGASPYNPHYRAADIGGATNGNSELPVNIRMAAQPQ